MIETEMKKSLIKNNMTPKILYSAIIASLSSMILGINFMLQNCMFEVFKTKNTQKDVLFKDHIHCTSFQWALFVSVLSLGAPLYNLLFSNILIFVFKLQRKSILIFGSILYFLGLLFISCCINYQVLLVGRLLIGISAGITSTIVPLYLNSIAPEKYSLLICSLHQLFMSIGIIIGQVISYFFNTIDSWKMGINLVAAFVALNIFFLIFIKNPFNATNLKKRNSGLMGIFNDKFARKALLLGIVLHVGQQLSCINGLLQFSLKVLEKYQNPQLYSIFMCIFIFACTVGSIILINLISKRTLLLSSVFFVIVGLFLFSISFNPIVSGIVFIGGFSFGMGPVPWLALGYIFDREFEDMSTSIVVSLNWISSFAVGCAFPTMLEKMKNYAFIVFDVIMVMMFLYLFIVFERKGK